MNVAKQIWLAFLITYGIGAAQAPSDRSPYPYVLRLEHFTLEEHSCALLQNTGAFHLEVDHGDDVKVFEGTIATSDLFDIESDLNRQPLVDLSQPQIAEPLIPVRRDVLRIAVFRGDHWQYLHFLTRDSQQPFQSWLQPLVYWLDRLHKLPHRELSEDEGKNNCLPREAITLKKRDTQIEAGSITPKSTSPELSAGAAPPQQPLQPARPTPPVLRVHLEMKASDSANDSCVLINPSGEYRFEERTQKAGKPVNTRIIASRITAEELQLLGHLLDDPALVKIRHHEPPGGMVVRVMGDMLDVSISRPAGVQQFILSSSFNRPGFPSFYRGDADSSNARPLLKFLSEHVETNQATSHDPASLNGCSEAR